MVILYSKNKNHDDDSAEDNMFNMIISLLLQFL